eukprot:SAG11_NODE_493_length_8965_cov_4.112339_2_plen_262_part_00
MSRARRRHPQSEQGASSTPCVSRARCLRPHNEHGASSAPCVSQARCRRIQNEQGASATPCVSRAGCRLTQNGTIRVPPQRRPACLEQGAAAHRTLRVPPHRLACLEQGASSAFGTPPRKELLPRASLPRVCREPACREQLTGGEIDTQGREGERGHLLWVPTRLRSTCAQAGALAARGRKGHTGAVPQMCPCSPPAPAPPASCRKSASRLAHARLEPNFSQRREEGKGREAKKDHAKCVPGEADLPFFHMRTCAPAVWLTN